MRRATRPRRRLTVLLVLALALPLGLVQGPAAAATAAEPGGCRPLTLDHAGLPHGTLLAEQYAADGVHLSAVANEGRPHQLVVFDSGRTGTPDPDLQAGTGNRSRSTAAPATSSWATWC